MERKNPNIDFDKRRPEAEEEKHPYLYGWVCPVCGRGLSPYTVVCPCANDGKDWEITC